MASMSVPPPLLCVMIDVSSWLDLCVCLGVSIHVRNVFELGLFRAQAPVGLQCSS